MKKHLILILLMLTYQQLRAHDDSLYHELTFKSRLFVNLLVSNEFDKAFEFFDDNMKTAFPLDKFEATWHGIIQQVGDLQEIEKEEMSPYGDKNLVVLTGKFEKMRLDIRLVYHSEGKMAGFFLAPNYDLSEYDTPYYADINEFEEREVAFGTEDAQLKGILSIPVKRAEKMTELFPVVILVHGSGPNDMDESIGPNKPFKDIAWGLASRRIAVFRYNKRTYEYPEKIIDELEKFTVWDETINDALEAINKMANMPDIDPKSIYVLGHSLGGMLAPRIQKKDKALAGLILMAANARPFHELIIPQYEYLFNLDGEITAEEKEKLDTIKAQVRRIESKDLNVDTDINLLPFNVPAAYWLDLIDYYPAREAGEIKCRMLILQGDRDYQVIKSEWEHWVNELSHRKNVEYRNYPSLNHIFMEGVGKSSPNEYTIKSHIPEYVINDIANFVMRKKSD